MFFRKETLGRAVSVSSSSPTQLTHLCGSISPEILRPRDGSAPGSWVPEGSTTLPCLVGLHHLDRVGEGEAGGESTGSDSGTSSPPPGSESAQGLLQTLIGGWRGNKTIKWYCLRGGNNCVCGEIVVKAKQQ